MSIATAAVAVAVGGSVVGGGVALIVVSGKATTVDTQAAAATQQEARAVLIETRRDGIYLAAALVDGRNVNGGVTATAFVGGNGSGIVVVVGAVVDATAARATACSGISRKNRVFHSLGYKVRVPIRLSVRLLPSLLLLLFFPN